MSGLRTAESASTKLQRIAELAKQDQQVRFTSLAHLMTPDFLRESFLKLRQKAAPGVDGETMAKFRENLDERIREIHEDLQQQRYRATPVRRRYIPKGQGKQRPLGIPTVADRTVQRAVAEIVGAIYEPYFCEFSHGFRPGRSCHDALESLRKTIDRSNVSYVVEADIKGYFDHVNHAWMMKFLEHRIADRTLLRLIGKWLRVGVMENGVVTRSEQGTPQGGPLSPLLANIYLHYVLDLWFEKKIRPTVAGSCAMVRYADDFVVGFASLDEAERFLRQLRERFSAFHLELAEEKTRIIRFGRSIPPEGPGSNEDPRSFVFLGFTHYMRERPKRGYRVARKPSLKSRNRFLASCKEWLQLSINRSVWFQSKQLSAKLRGYYNYFGLRYCLPALDHVKWHVERLWVQILRRRSQRHRLYWKQIQRYPWFSQLPSPSLR